MKKPALAFLKKMLDSPSPSGYEGPIQKVIREFANEFADDVSTDWHGNVVAAVNPEGSPRIMLAGHCDHIGLMVKHIDKDGYLRFTPIGGWASRMRIGQRFATWQATGPGSGVIARNAIPMPTA